MPLAWLDGSTSSMHAGTHGREVVWGSIAPCCDHSETLMRRKATLIVQALETSDTPTEWCRVTRSDLPLSSKTNKVATAAFCMGYWALDSRFVFLWLHVLLTTLINDTQQKQHPSHQPFPRNMSELKEGWRSPNGFQPLLVLDAMISSIVLYVSLAVL